MFIIWKGWGILVVGIAVLIQLILSVLFGSDFLQDDYRVSLGLILAGVATWFAGKYFNRPIKKVFIEKDIGETLVTKPSNSLFFIKMEYWGPIMFVFAVIILLF